MSDKSFVLMSLKEEKVKKMTQVLNNDTCRKILDLLSKKERATATEISKELKIAMSTIHYNLKQLKENNLVTSDEYHYSEKGKEVIHYGLANKYIIIAPKEDKSVLEKLKSFIPITLISAFAAGALFLLEKNFSKILNVLKGKTPEVAGMTQEFIMMETDTIKAPMRATTETILTEPTTSMLIAPWFLLGAVFVIIIMIAYELSKKK